jgi:diadenosine tetraphosphate (Ap4A) HIT family hydrolase
MQIPEQCESCAYAADPSGVLYQTDYWRLVLARDQAYLGRSYLVLKDHKSSLGDLTSEEWQDYEQLVRRIESAYERAFAGGRPFNWACLMNNAFKKQPAVPHVHWHLWPRHAQPITVGNTTFTDTEYAHHHSFDRKQIVDDETFKLIFDKIQPYIAT